MRLIASCFTYMTLSFTLGWNDDFFGLPSYTLFLLLLPLALVDIYYHEKKLKTDSQNT